MCIVLYSLEKKEKKTKPHSTPGAWKDEMWTEEEEMNGLGWAVFFLHSLLSCHASCDGKLSQPGWPLTSTHTHTNKHHECSTHQSYEQEADQCHLSQHGGAGDVPEAHRAHGHHEEVDAVGVANLVHVREVGRVAGVLQLTGEEQQASGNTRVEKNGVEKIFKGLGDCLFGRVGGAEKKRENEGGKEQY